MYELIAEQYSRLFPPDKNRSGFILEELEQTPESLISVLDAGCATGDLAFELAAAGCRTTGIDIDRKMIEIARKRAENEAPHPSFRILGLADIEGLGPFNAIICFGNTLPHLPDETAVKDFFKKASRTIIKGGRLIFQIINFDQLKDNDYYSFPDIDTGVSIFKRSYQRRTDGRLDFKISIVNKENNETISEQTPLIPLMREKLLEMLIDSGFQDIRIYSNYDRTPASGMEFASIYSAAPIINGGFEKTDL